MIATTLNCHPSPSAAGLVGQNTLPSRSTTHATGVPRLEYINPAEIRKSRWHVPRCYRHTDTISDAVLLGSIRHFGTNLQPIKVRPCPPGADDKLSIRFELVFGERRRSACLELGIPVLALIDNLNDQQAFAQAEACTFQADAPTLLERGTRFEQVIDEQTFVSARDLISGAGLPSDVVDKSLAVHTLLEVLDRAFRINSGLHDHFARRLNRCADQCPSRLIGLARSSAALQWNTLLSGLNEIDPPILEPRRKRRRGKAK
jgi:ParB family chromosome partitioning protein